MHVYARTGLVGVLAAAVVVTSAGPGHALDPGPRQVIPSSVVGSLDGMSPAERARAVGNVAPVDARITVPGSSAGTVTKGAGGGPFLAGVSAFFVGFEGANTALRWAGVDNVGLEALFPPTPDTTYIPNADVPITAPGFTNGTQLIGRAQRKFTNDPYVPAQIDVEAFGDTISTSIRISASGAPADHFTSTGYVVTCGDGVGTFSANKNIDMGKTFPTDGNVHILSSSTCGTNGTLTDVKFSASTVDGTQSVTHYIPEGVAGRPEGGQANVQRRWEVRYSCSNGPGGVAASALFSELDATWPAVPQATCADGRVTSAEIWQVVPSDPSLDVLLDSYTEPSGVTDWQTAYPQCTDGSCVLELARIDQGTRLDCFGNPSACVDWWTTAEPTRSERFECRYAGAVVALGECRVYAPTFNVATNTPVQTQTGVRPATEVERLADPATGEPVPKASPGPGTGTGEQPEGCPPAFNLTALANGYWVYKGVACALSEAFVPSASIQTRLDQVTQTARTRSPWPELGAIGAWLQPPSLVGRCLRYTVGFPQGSGLPTAIPVIDTCDPEHPVVKAMEPLRPLLAVAVWVAVTAPLAWWAWREYAPGAKGVA